MMRVSTFQRVATDRNRFNEPEIQLFEARIDWQHHQRQEHVGQSHKDGRVRIEDLQRLADQAQPHQQAVDDALIRVISKMAKVRMRRFVQNGMVMRKSQSSRVRSDRVAMK